MRILLALFALFATLACASTPSTPDGPTTAPPDKVISAAALDAYIDMRFAATPADRAALLSEFALHGVDGQALESALRGPRASYPASSLAPGALSDPIPVTCFHVDYTSVYYLRLPTTFSGPGPWPVLVVGHGGNSSMSADYARSTAVSYANAYAPLADQLGAIMVVPATERGWSPIGDSLIFSVLSDLQRRYWLDADRVMLTGQSMGGHLAWRSAMNFSDSFAAFVPMSGGYPEWADVETFFNLWDTTGFHTWGQTEPYKLDTINETLQAFLAAHGYRWEGGKAPGNHPIATSYFTTLAARYKEARRELYASSASFRGSGAMQYTSNWKIEGWPEHTIDLSRPLMYNEHRFVRIAPRLDEPGLVQKVVARISGNTVELKTNNVRQLTVMLHPAMGLDLAAPVKIVVNGEVKFDGVVPPDLGRMLDLVKEFDDRGRIFWGFVDLAIATDQAIAAPWDAW